MQLLRLLVEHASQLLLNHHGLARRPVTIQRMLGQTQLKLQLTKHRSKKDLGEKENGWKRTRPPQEDDG
jgi:hypothetical protein